MSKILAFLNFKGGVGKTTDTVNIAAMLAYHPRCGPNRVLVVDLDPQCNSTFWLVRREGYQRAREKRQTMFELFHAFRLKQQVERLSAGLITPVSHDDGIGGGIDLLCGSFDLLELEEDSSLGNHSAVQATTCLMRGLAPLRDHYDFILIDCPPSFSILTKNALRAADHVLVPYMPDYLAMQGILWMGQLQRRLALQVRANGAKAKVAEMTGIIVNRYKAGANAPLLAIREMEDVVNQMKDPDTAILPERFRVFKPYIRDSVAIIDAENNQRHLLMGHERDGITQDFADVTRAILDHIR